MSIFCVFLDWDTYRQNIVDEYWNEFNAQTPEYPDSGNIEITESSDRIQNMSTEMTLNSLNDQSPDTTIANLSSLDVEGAAFGPHDFGFLNDLDGLDLFPEMVVCEPTIYSEDDD